MLTCPVSHGQTDGFVKPNVVIHYTQANGFPGNYAYGVFEDHQGYLWITTENGLARYNGYEFKLFTTRDGLPDNEAFSVNEDATGRLWFLPFANTIGYIRNEKVYHAGNDTTLRKLYFKKRPNSIKFDKYGNTIIYETRRLTIISPQGKISHWQGLLHDTLDLEPVRNATGLQQFIDGAMVYEYNGGNKVHRIGRVPGSIERKEIRYLFGIAVTQMSLDSAYIFTKRVEAAKSPFFSKKDPQSIHGVQVIPPRMMSFTRRDGFYLVDFATGHIVDTLLYGCYTNTGTIASDGSLWVGTSGKGLFRFIRSPVKSLKLPDIPASVLYIRGQADGMYALMDDGMMVQAAWSKSGALQAGSPQYLRGRPTYNEYVYLGRDARGNWIEAGTGLIASGPLHKASTRKLYVGASKTVFEEDDHHLLVATHTRLTRVNTDLFEEVDTLVHERTTSVVKSRDMIYTGTLHGLLAGKESGRFHQVLPDVPALNVHIVKLGVGADGIVWAGNNRTELAGVRGDSLVTIIDDKDGLQCHRISAIRASPRFIWVGTDNGLYAVQNAPPYPVVRHLTRTTGLNSNQVNCLDVYKDHVWVGTDNGINYFDEQAVFQSRTESRIIINSITSGGKDLNAGSKKISLPKKDLTIDFDIIDFAGGQKPLFRYRLNNDGNWISLENSNLYFPSTPYGDFTIHLQAISPNWKKNNQYTLQFYRPYPLYLRWWFILLTALLLAGLITGGVRLFVRRLRKKDQEKINVQRNLLQLEQLALQGQMNPHFIFNCISAIKQYYNSGNTAKANDFVDAFAALIRQTFEMSAETFVPLDKELSYLSQYLSIEQARFNHTFDFTITQHLELVASAIPIPAMLLQPLAENAVRHGIRHLLARRGEIHIVATQAGEQVKITVTDNGVGRQKSRSFARLITSTTVNTKRIDIMIRLFEEQIIYKTEDILDDQGEVAGTCVTISYPLSIAGLHA